MAAARQRHLARAAADEARLIMVSGELGLRHAADLTHAAAEKKPQAIFTHAAREVPLRVELLSYAASMVAAAALIAVALLVIGSRGGVMPLLH
jgi:hypothetical protein